MKVLDPGHYYELANLDVDPKLVMTPHLAFVKREGPGYPGNVGHHQGTTVQEVLRACIDRLQYVNAQDWSDFTDEARACLMQAVYLLEYRAALRHDRTPPSETDAVFGQCCPKCNHVGCVGGCH